MSKLHVSCFPLGVIGLVLWLAQAPETAALTQYFANQQVNAYLIPSGGAALTGGGHVGTYRDPSSPADPGRRIQSADGSLVLRQSAIASTVVAFAEGMPHGYALYIAMGNATKDLGTDYKKQQMGSTTPWDLRFPGVVQLNEGTLWPSCTNCNQNQNFDETTVGKAAEYYRVAIRANPFDLEARTNLISTYNERMVAHIFAGNNAAQYASGHRLASGSIADEICYWSNAISHYQASGDILLEAMGLMPDAATFESPLYAEHLQDTVEIFARGLAYEAEAVRTWLQLKYFESYRDPLSTPYSPDSLLASLQSRLHHIQNLLFFTCAFTHVPNYLTVDFASVQAALAALHKQKNTSIPLGMLSFARSRTDTPGEAVGEYAPHYVPFLYKDSPTSLPTSFENLLQQASELITASVKADDEAKIANRQFDTDSSALKDKLNEIFSNYNSQLGDLCGLVYADDGQLHPDVIGSLLPPEDRVFQRPFQFQNGESPGRIYQQYLVLSQAWLELEAAEQDRHNIYLKAENAKTVGELIASQHEALAQMYLTNGASQAALERMRGEEAARITRAIARKQYQEAKRQESRGIWAGLGAVVGALGVGILTIIFPPAGIAGASAWALGGGLFAAASSGIAANTWAQSANAHGSAALILQTGEMQAQLAKINAEIDAQKEQIRALEAATIQFAERDVTLWKTEEAWQAAMLDYERSALNVLIAEQRLLMQEAELANLHTRVAFLVQEMRKAIVLNTQTVNPLARPDYRLWMDYVNQSADDAFLRAQEWLYLAAKALQYKVNRSEFVSDVGGRIQAILQARRGQVLLDLHNLLSTDLNTLYRDQAPETFPLEVPIGIRNYVAQNNWAPLNEQGEIDLTLSLFETQTSGTNTLAASDAAWLAFLRNHTITNFGTVRLEIPFCTSLQQPNVAPLAGFDPLKKRVNPLFSEERYGDLITYDRTDAAAFGVRVNIRGRKLILDASKSVLAYLRQEGASWLRTMPYRENPRAFQVWNLKPINGLVLCSINGEPADARTPQFHERSPANDRWVLVIGTGEGAGVNNAALLSQLENITEIEISFCIKSFTN